MKVQSHTRSSPVQTNIDSIIRLEEKALQALSTGERVSNSVARFAGSMLFVELHVVWYAGWCLINLGMIPGIPPFDPFPFSLLTMIVSLEAIFLSIFLLISQNAMSRQADRRAHLDLQVNLLAEQESTWMLEMMQRLCKHLGVKMDDLNAEIEQLAKRTDIHDLVTELNDKLPSAENETASST